MHNKRVIESPKLLIGGTLWCALCICICVACAWAIRIRLVSTTTHRDWVGCQIIFIFMAVYILICFILALPRWLRVISFNKNMITLKGAYGARKVMRYADIYDILLYTERRGLHSISYIIISKDKIYIKELCAAGQFKETDRMLVVRDRKVIRTMIYQALSPQQESTFGYRLLKNGIDYND